MYSCMISILPFFQMDFLVPCLNSPRVGKKAEIMNLFCGHGVNPDDLVDALYVGAAAERGQRAVRDSFESECWTAQALQVLADKVGGEEKE